MNRKNVLNNLNTLLGIVGGSIAVKGAINASRDKPVMDRLIESQNTITDLAARARNDRNKINLYENKLESAQSHMNRYMALKNKVETTTEDAVSEDTRKSLEEMSNILEKVNELLQGGGPKNSSSFTVNSINDMIRQYTDYVNSLELTQLIALSNLIITVLLVYNIFTLLMIFFSEYLIKYFNLESKHNLIARIIKYRRRVQKINLYFSIIVIVGCLVTLLWFNLLMFIS